MSNRGATGRHNYLLNFSKFLLVAWALPLFLGICPLVLSSAHAEDNFALQFDGKDDFAYIDAEQSFNCCLDQTLPCSTEQIS